MKKFFKSDAAMRITLSVLFLMFSFMGVSAQSTYIRQGSVYTVAPTKKNEPKQTSFTYVDNKGQTYPIYITATGRCFVMKTSQKTNKTYRYYLSEDISKDVCQQLGITYVPTKKKQS